MNMCSELAVRKAKQISGDHKKNPVIANLNDFVLYTRRT